MRCGVCGTEHRYANPKQFSSWARRHRAKRHADVQGKIPYHRVREKRESSKRWTPIEGQLGFSTKVMLRLPPVDPRSTVWLDRRTGIFWRFYVGSSADTAGRWSWWRMPAKKTKAAT